MSALLRIVERNRYFRKLTSLVGFGTPSEIICLESSRQIEYPWILKNLKLDFGRVLDVGSTGSIFPIVLASLGYDVYSIDVREYGLNVPERLRIRFFVGDIRCTNFPNEFFDAVTAVSTIEHIGLGRYGDTRDLEGDRKAILEIMRVLKKEGTFLMTVPFGIRHTSLLHRVYDDERLKSLLHGYSPDNIELFKLKDRYWLISTVTEIRNVDSSKIEKAIACIKLKRIQ